MGLQEQQRRLTNRLKKFYPNQVHVAGFLLPPHSRLNWRHPSRNQCRGRDRRRRDRKCDNAANRERSRTRKERAQPANVKCPRELNELFAVRVPAADEERHLEVDPLKAASLFC